MQKLREVFSQTLRAFRVKSGLSQEALGLESDLGRTYIGELERAQKDASIRTLFRICETLKIKPSDFIAQMEKRLKK